MLCSEKIRTPWRTDNSLGQIPASFGFLSDVFFTPLGSAVSNIEREPESSDYGAIRFRLNGLTCLFRQARQTPKKTGQFVTLWKRPTPEGNIAPFDINDGIDRVIVFTDEQERCGVFVFHSETLIEKKIFATQPEGGKRGFRLYAPWTTPVAAQAIRSKKWQCASFVELTQPGPGRARLGRIL